VSVRTPRAGRVGLAALVATAASLLVAPQPSGAAHAVPGSSGTDTSVAPTDSKVTVRGRGRFSDLELTVNQTRNLANQAVSVTWTGGRPTTDFGGGSGTIGEHFLQMFQCWGDDDGSNAGNPGPPPEQCQQGATAGAFEGSPTGTIFQGNTLTRVISQRGAPNFDPSLGTLDEFGSVSLPFRAVDGTVVPQWRDTSFNPQISGGNFWLNPYFNIITTNEIAGARTQPDGTGADLFEASTGLESSGLGCGQSVQEQTDGSTKVPRCWLVVVPRGGAAEENEGAGISPFFGVATSPLAPAAWRNRIAIPLEFNPVDSSCPLAADQRRIVGSELASGAVASWQPALCATSGLSPYAFGAISDSRAREQLVQAVPGSAGMAVTSRPIDPALVDPENPVVYAPLTLSGTVIGFNIERLPRVVFPSGQEPSEEVLAGARDLAGVRVAQLNLTPRLVAKLLTQSYRSQVEIAATKPPYPWAPANPLHIGVDPDFLQFNPEFELLRTDTKNMGGLVVPGPGSDGALRVWEWVLADPEASSWLAGTPDPFGMSVNPVFSTSPAVHPQGVAFGDPVPDSYPKNDPYCYQGTEVGPLKVVPPALCGLDWMPYTQTLRDAARATRAASDRARTLVNPSPSAADQVYKQDPPQALGQRAILSITDSASAAQYGVQVARLSRSGDNNPDRRFIAPDGAGLTAGAAAIVAGADPGTGPAEAYPLTELTAAAVTPLGLDDTARREYAAFVEYAVGPGQTPGFEYGRLPAGYQPLPEDLRARAMAAARLIRELTVDEEAEAPPEAAETPTGPRSGLEPALLPTPAPRAQPGAGEGRPPVPPAAAGAAGTATSAPAKRVLERVAESRPSQRYRVGASRYALPVLVVVALLSGLGALEITKRRSRHHVGVGSPTPATRAAGPS
jgi:hypothetical protein